MVRVIDTTMNRRAPRQTPRHRGGRDGSGVAGADIVAATPSNKIAATRANLIEFVLTSA